MRSLCPSRELTGAREATRKPALGMRTDELDMRVAELLEAGHVMRRIGAGEGAAVASESTRVPGAVGYVGPAKPQIDWADWRGRFTTDDGYTWLGHSFGAGSVAHALQTVDPALISSAILLDPWLEPVPTVDKPISKRVLCLNQAGFTLWRSHFGTLPATLPH